MKTKSLVLFLGLAVTICISGNHAVKANNPAPGGATVKGMVKVEGTLSRPKSINMAADPSCSKLHSGPVLTGDVMADSKGGLQNVIVFVSDGLGDRTFAPPSEPAVIEQKGCLYEPHVVALRANQPLQVVNADPTTHNIHPMPVNNREWNRAELPGSTMKEAFSREEIAIPVKCNIHPWMRGYVAVFNHPYFTVTGKDGSFDLSNLPPGTYTLKAWHEKLGTATQQVTVGGNESKSIEFTFKAM